MVGSLLSPLYLLIPQCFKNYLPPTLNNRQNQQLPSISMVSTNGSTHHHYHHHLNGFQWMKSYHHKLNNYDDSESIQSITNGINSVPKSTIISSEKEEKWRKVLYERQGVPDNYVPSTFLNDLRKNVNLRMFRLMEAIVAASFVVQQIILIVNMVLMFIYFDRYQNRYDPLLFTIVALVTMFLYSIIFLSFKLQELIQFKSCLIFLLACFSMSPILKTLTETISTDTIYTHCTLMAIIHLVFHDYGLDAAIVSRPISLNAIFFASVCLASRLSTTFHAFAFLIFSLDLFVLIESMYKTLPRRNKLAFTATFTVVTLALIAMTFGIVGFLVAISCFSFINILCPYIFYRMQSLKTNIYGPWDEAIIDQSKLAFTFANTNHVKPVKNRRKSHKKRLNSDVDELLLSLPTTDQIARISDATSGVVDFFR